MKRTLWVLTGCLTTGVLVILILLASAKNLSLAYNSFNRTFIAPDLVKLNELDVRFNSYYLAGADSTHLYLGNSTAPRHLLVTNRMLSDSQHITIQVPALNRLAPRVSVLPPFFYLMDGKHSAILTGTTDSWKVSASLNPTRSFIDVVVTDTASFVIRCLDQRENTLGKLDRSSAIQLHPHLLEKQIDGIFCTDGMLLYNQQLKKVLYLYYYRNQYLVMDTALTHSFTGNTIDTISRAKIEIAEIESDKSITLSGPPLKVNRKCSTYGRYLYIVSGVMAKNETPKSFLNASVVDVYDILKQEYAYSFYLPNHGGDKAQDFIVSDSLMFALYGRSLVAYLLPTSDNLNTQEILPVGSGMKAENL